MQDLSTGVMGNVSSCFEDMLRSGVVHDKPMLHECDTSVKKERKPASGKHYSCRQPPSPLHTHATTTRYDGGHAHTVRPTLQTRIWNTHEGKTSAKRRMKKARSDVRVACADQLLTLPSV